MKDEALIATVGLFGPDTVFWRINRERIVLLAGPAAAVLQVAHPSVARGVYHHSRFRDDAGGRLRRTLDAVYSVGFGDDRMVETTRKQIAKMHSTVRGEGYSAFDPSAQLWVIATLIMGSVSMYERFIKPLSTEEKASFLRENHRFASVFGLPDGWLPTEWPSFEAYWHEMLHGELLGSDPVCGEVAQAVVQPLGRGPTNALISRLALLAMGVIPQHLCFRLGLPHRLSSEHAWQVLDRIVPRLHPLLPSVIRFAGPYRRALRRVNAPVMRSS